MHVEAEDFYAGVFPWDPATSASVVTLDMLHLSLYRAREEVDRSQEESSFIHVDALVLIATYQHQQQVLSSFALSMQAQGSLTQGLAHCILICLFQNKMMMHQAHALFSKHSMLPL